ncbi:MAG: hypothetical protein Q7V05_07170, partial [Methanoregula sp.]|nr:hypothetical protein [Methanoregula sp.]
PFLTRRIVMLYLLSTTNILIFRLYFGIQWEILELIICSTYFFAIQVKETGDGSGSGVLLIGIPHSKARAFYEIRTNGV